MDPLIRSAVLADDRRRLRRPQPAAAPAPAVVPAAETAEQMRRDAEQRLADGRRELEQERDAMRKTLAAEQAEALEQAAERGYEEGLRRGEADGRKALDEEVARLGALLADLRQQRAQVLDAAEDTMVEIAFAALCRLAGSEAASRDAAVHAVRQAGADLRAGDALTVFVHPDDLAQLGGRLGQQGVTLLAGGGVELGGCMIDGATGTLDARLETQVQGLRAALLDARAARRRGDPA